MMDACLYDMTVLCGPVDELLIQKPGVIDRKYKWKK